MYKERENEDKFKILLCKLVVDNDTKFKEYFRVTRNQFFALLDLIKIERAVHDMHQFFHFFLQSPPTLDLFSLYFYNENGL